MMATLLPWWRDRSSREQWLLGIMAGLLVIVIAWFGIIRPIAAARDAATARHAEAIQSLGDVQAMAGTIRAAEARRGKRREMPLVELVNDRAAGAGFTFARLDKNGDGRVNGRIDAIKPVAMLRWISDLEARDGVIVDQLRITRNADETVAVDLALRSGN